MVIINGFCKIVARDFRRICGPEPKTDQKKILFRLSIVRLLSAAFIGGATVIFFKGVFISSLFDGAFKIALSVALYAVAHDAFIAAKNKEKEILDQKRALLTSQNSEETTLNTQDDPSELEVSSPDSITKGTILEALWNQMIASYYKTDPLDDSVNHSF